MNSTYSELLDILLNPAVTFLVGIITVFMSRYQDSYPVARERLDNVYHPLFVAIEPFLYRKVSCQSIKSFLLLYREINASHSLLINPSLKLAMQRLRSFHFIDDGLNSFDEWFCICDLISKDYDSLCRQCHIPVRTIAYRVKKKQYRNKLTLFIGWFFINFSYTLSIPCLIACIVYPELWFMPYIAFILVYSKKFTNRL